jgi:hypothetical protein
VREPPVHDRRKRRERVGAQRAVLQRAVVERGEPGERGEQHNGGGEEAPGPAAPEAPDVAAAIARPLVDDQARDEEPGEDEEHVHTEPATG